MKDVVAALGRLHPSLAALQGVPLYVFLLVAALTGAFLLGYLIKGTQVWWQLRSTVRAVRSFRGNPEPPPPEQVGRAFRWEPLKHLWEEYADTLHEFRRASSGLASLTEVRATVPSETMFTREVLVDGRLFDDFTRHLPGVLTGLGIIGTFAGLLDGLREFKPTPIEAAVNGLGPLLLGVQHAFVASGAAIACAMGVVFVSRFTLAYFYRLVEHLTHGIDSLYSTGAGEEYLSRLVKSSEQSAASTAQLKDALVEDLNKMMTNLVERQIAAQEASSVALGQHIGESISNAIAEPMKRVGEAMEVTAKGNGDQVNSMLETLLTGFMAKLEDTFGGQMRGINDQMQRSMDSMAAVQTSLQDLLTDIKQTNEHAANQMSGTLEDAMKKAADNQQLLTEQMREFAWAATVEVAAFGRRKPEDHTQHFHELAWGRVRRLADRAGALYATPYLETTYVVTPDTLRLPLSKQDTPFGRVLTVSPTFDGAPDGWLTAFDGFNSVQPHYDLTRGEGRVRVVISEPVRKVLHVIKRQMPGRKVAGAKAEKFVHNPFAFLGESAYEVLREDEFQADRAGAGAVAAVFSIVGRFEHGRVDAVELLVTEHYADGAAKTGVQKFSAPEQLQNFLAALRSALEQERERFPWGEYDLSLDGESTVQLEQGQQLAKLWRTQPAQRIEFDDVYELDGYSSRIEGIGAVRAIYVPVFQREKKEDDGSDGWLPQDLTPMIKVTLQEQEGHVLIPLTTQWVEEFDKQVKDAEAAGQHEVRNGSLPTAVTTAQARTLVDSFKNMLTAQNAVRGDKGAEKTTKKTRQTLLVKTNFHDVDYLEERRASLALPADWKAELPACLRAGIQLKKHQMYGVAWFQHLISRAPSECRGALLADDMGLGKTLQLLSVMAWYYEANPAAAPSVIFAPKSLLENWANEARKFFTPSFPEVLVLYGDQLTVRKQPLSLIDSQLQDKGIVELLKPDWVGTAKIIITTYEVLTSYEFSLAKQAFFMIVCDEAQRIKTPGTLVQEKELRRVAKGAVRAPAAPDSENDAGEVTKRRFSASRLAAHRAKLGLSAAIYGQLVGVSGQTIYHWEQGKARPRAAQLESLAAVRELGAREIAEHLTTR